VNPLIYSIVVKFRDGKHFNSLNASYLFFFTVIPLAKKLKECGVFGVSSDEYLTYAMKNREEWIARGEDVVQNLLEEARELYG